jgi:iron complex transport system ATP-binding protein
MELALKNVDVSIGRQKIVQDVTLSVNKGEFVGIIGPNGSGKSTLLRAVYRLIKPSRGAIFLNRENLNNIKLAESARKMGVVGQFNTVNFDFSVLDMVMMGRTPHKQMFGANNREDYQIAWAALEQVGMAGYAQRGFSTLSGGEKQRIVLARALAQQPQILILDEPTNHLDIKYQLQILSIVKSLGIGILAVLHDLSLAAMHCNKLYVLKEGVVAASGAPEKILTPELIRDVYEIDCDIRKNPDTGYWSISYYSSNKLSLVSDPRSICS